MQLLVGSVNETNGTRFVKRSDELFIYAVATNVIDQLPGSYGRLRSRVVFDLNPDQVTQLTAGDVTILASGEQGKVAARGPEARCSGYRRGPGVCWAPLSNWRSNRTAVPKPKPMRRWGYAIKAGERGGDQLGIDCRRWTGSGE